MTNILQTGTTVRLVQPVIQGEVKEATILDGQIHYRVEYTDAEGNTHERLFPESALEIVAQ